MRTLRETIEDARSRQTAVGHFNISDSNQLKAIAETAREMNLPVMIGLSEGERGWLGIKQAVALIKSYRDAGQEIYLNADHTKSFEAIKIAIDAGFDEVLFDGSRLSIDENIALTRDVVAYARGCGRDVMVEGELGYIGSGSTLLDAIPEGAADQTRPPFANCGESVARTHGAQAGGVVRDLIRIADQGLVEFHDVGVLVAELVAGAIAADDDVLGHRPLTVPVTSA